MPSKSIENLANSTLFVPSLKLVNVAAVCGICILEYRSRVFEYKSTDAVYIDMLDHRLYRVSRMFPPRL